MSFGYGRDVHNAPAGSFVPPTREPTVVRAIPIIPIVHGTQRLEKLSFPIARPVSIERGLEFHDQMFAIKLLLVLQEALGGEPLAGRGSAPRA